MARDQPCSAVSQQQKNPPQNAPKDEIRPQDWGVHTSEASFEAAIFHTLDHHERIKALNFQLVCQDNYNRFWAISNTNPEPRRIYGVNAGGSFVPSEWLKSVPADTTTASHTSKKRVLPKTIVHYTKTQPLAENTITGFGSEEDSDSDSDEDMDDFQGVTQTSKPYRVDEIGNGGEKGLYCNILRLIQQKGCKKIVGAWLKKGHPKKQASNPYNGGPNPHKAEGFDRNNPGQHTAPPYWPSQVNWRETGSIHACRHRETDHIKRNERLCLMLHLLKNGDKYPKYHFDIDTLEASTANITEQHREHFHAGADGLLEQLYYCRRKEIAYNRGEIDGDTTIHVTLPDKPSARSKSKNKTLKPSKKKRKMSSRDGQVVLKTPQSSDASCAAPIANMANETASEDDDHPPDSPRPSQNDRRPRPSAETGDSQASSRSASLMSRLSQSGMNVTQSMSSTQPHDTAALVERMIEHRSSIHGNEIPFRPLSEAAQRSTLMPWRSVQGQKHPTQPFPNSMDVKGPQILKSEVTDTPFQSSFAPQAQPTQMNYEDYVTPISQSPYPDLNESNISPNATRSMETYPRTIRPSYSSSGLEGVAPSHAFNTNPFTPYVAPSQLTAPTTSHSNLHPRPSILQPQMGFPSTSSDFSGALQNDPDWLHADYWLDFAQEPKPSIYARTADPGAVLSSISQPPAMNMGRNSWLANQYGNSLPASDNQVMAQAQQRSLSFQSIGASGDGMLNTNFEHMSGGGVDATASHSLPPESHSGVHPSYHQQQQHYQRQWKGEG